jgi:predicted transcriptional regulator of viral defense system
MKLLAKIPKVFKSRPFTTVQAKKWGFTKRTLRKMVLEGDIEKLARGIYRISQDDIPEEDQFRVATLRVGKPSAVCLVSALSYHNLTDLIPKKTWIMVPLNKRTEHADLKVFRVKKPFWKIGIDQHEGYAVTSIERTVVDALNYRSILGSNTAVEALKRCVVENMSTPRKISDMAKKLKVLHRILPYLESIL